jgi:hypothetical protein
MLGRWIGLGSVVLALSGCYSYEPPGGKFVKLSQLARFPNFYPGLGTIYVQPDTMPIGPYYSYDRLGHQVNTIYMVPMTFFDQHKIDPLIEGSHLKVDHVTLRATVPGWQRFAPVAEWLTQGGSMTDIAARQRAAYAAAHRTITPETKRPEQSDSQPDKEELFQEFLEWQKHR